MNDRESEMVRRLNIEIQSLREENAKLREEADIAYSEMAFTLHDICDPRRRKDDDAWREYRGERLAKAADRLRDALKRKGE